MKKLCKLLRENTVVIIYFNNKKMKLLTKYQQKSYENAKICHICQEKFEVKHAKDKNIVIVITRVNIEVLHIPYVI